MMMVIIVVVKEMRIFQVFSTIERKFQVFYCHPLDTLTLSKKFGICHFLCWAFVVLYSSLLKTHWKTSKSFFYYIIHEIFHLNKNNDVDNDDRAGKHWEVCARLVQSLGALSRLEIEIRRRIINKKSFHLNHRAMSSSDISHIC